jgi:ATP-grasp domain
MSHVLLISPGYPAEMPEFTRGLAEVGASVFGIGDQPAAALPPLVKRSLRDYLQVRSLWDVPAVLADIRRWLGTQTLDRVECLWEPGMLLAAHLREGLRVPGMTVAKTVPFRDKEVMKRVLDAAGIRTPRHMSCRTANECREAAARIGYPLIVKPIAGAGSADTYRLDSASELAAVLGKLTHVAEVSVEEFVDGEEFTFDTVTIDGRIAYYNVAWYRPRPLIARSNEWISPQVIALRDPDTAELAGGVRMGFEVIRALGFETGFTHMEWYRKADGEVVFGEIGGRPPGAHQVDQMNFASDFDVYREWARAVTQGRFAAPIERKYNVATIYKRAQGQGTIRRITGLEEFKAQHGGTIVWDSLLRPGALRRNWKATLVSDGFVMLRHADLPTTCALADRIGSEVQLFAS